MTFEYQRDKLAILAWASSTALRFTRPNPKAASAALRSWLKAIDEDCAVPTVRTERISIDHMVYDNDQLPVNMSA